MSTLVHEIETPVLLHNVTWEDYERILGENEENRSKRFFYDNGTLEIMVVSARHEGPSELLKLLVQLVAHGLGVPVYAVGSMTCKRRDLQKGFEADSSFYVARGPEMEDRDIDLEVDPPPDLIVEVEVTNPALPHFPIYSAIRVPELWRYNHRVSRVEFYHLEGAEYVETDSSIALPPLTAEIATRLLKERKRRGPIEWFDYVQEWARQQR
jgi:Uma2 family endonuclease